MALTKSMIKTLIAVMNGSDTLEKLRDSLKATKSWAARTAEKLEKAGFVDKSRKGISMKIQPAATTHAVAFKEMYFDKPYRKYEGAFSGRNLDILMCIASSPKTAKTIGEMLKVQPRAARLRLRHLASAALISKTGGKYALAKDERLRDFLKSLNKFPTEKGNLLWKFKDEMLLKVRSPGDVKGRLTGFNRYDEYGVKVLAPAYLCYVGKAALNAESVFAHSLYEIEDARTLALALAFYAKNRLYRKAKLKKVRLLAERFDVPELLEEVVSTCERFKKLPAGSFIRNERLPSIDVGEIRREFEMYGVKNV